MGKINARGENLMQISYVVVVALVTYILGSFTKLKWSTLPHKYIPIQNVIIAIISTFICFFTKLESNFLQALILCFTATMGAGGIHDLLKSFQTTENTMNSNS